ncbi:hypothetical protein SDC9_151970 [bioreactor metagenome]|uniref:HTH cro/C1-type domain-containing protein n=1 Tax=bioreactor metagenome TaxID=1076179 RepID=A0A645ERS9_9ZZZZ
MNASEVASMEKRETQYEAGENTGRSDCLRTEDGAPPRNLFPPHVNGWRIIAAGLRARQLRQKDLARLLGVTPAAVSQIKSGRIKLNRRQIALIYNFLGLEEPDIRRLYAEIFNARLRFESPELEF